MKTKRLALILMFAGVALYGVQALVWRASAKGRTETAVENRTGHHPDPAIDLPALAGTALLILAGTIISIPKYSELER